jgi:hypothetical protein
MYSRRQPRAPDAAVARRLSACRLYLGTTLSSSYNHDCVQMRIYLLNLHFQVYASPRSSRRTRRLCYRQHDIHCVISLVCITSSLTYKLCIVNRYKKLEPCRLIAQKGPAAVAHNLFLNLSLYPRAGLCASKAFAANCSRNDGPTITPSGLCV